jgi:hypothetical protein
MTSAIPSSPERGSVIFYILIAIVAFASLSIAVTRGSRESVTTIDREKSDLAATEIFDYSNALRAAVQNMMIQGTKQNQLCFDNPAWGNTDFNYAACANPKNKVFDARGGGAPVQHNINRALLESAYASLPLAGRWYITSTMRIQGVGQDCDPSAACNDLTIVLTGIRREICATLNRKLGIANPDVIPANASAMAPAAYVGTYTFHNDSVVTAAALVGKRTGCFRDAAGPYTFYSVLAAN